MHNIHAHTTLYVDFLKRHEMMRKCLIKIFNVFSLVRAVPYSFEYARADEAVRRTTAIMSVAHVHERSVVVVRRSNASGPTHCSLH